MIIILNNLVRYNASLNNNKHTINPRFKFKLILRSYYIFYELNNPRLSSLKDSRWTVSVLIDF